MKGSEFLKQVMDVRNPQLSKLALAEMLRGSEPAFLDQKVSCFTEAVIDGAHYRCDYMVKPNYLAVGDDGDFILWPLTIIDLQAYCDAHVMTGSDPSDVTPKFFIPPKKLIFNNWYFSECKIAPQALGASNDMTWPLKITAEQDRINAAMQAAGCSVRAFSRAKKAYISAPNMSDKGGPTNEGVLHFTGWYNKDGSCIQCGDATGGHEASYADYSHGCDLIYYDVVVNGLQYNFDEVCNHPKLWPLVSDQGAFNPRFPNVGPNAKPPRQNLQMPPGGAPPADYKGPVFATVGGTAQMTSAGDLPTAAEVAASVDSSPTSKTGLVLGVGVAAAGAYLLYRVLKSPSFPY